MNSEISKKISELKIVKKQSDFIFKLKEKYSTANSSTSEKEVVDDEQDK